MESFLDEYHRSADKKRFLNERQNQNHALLQVCSIFFPFNHWSDCPQQHARDCERWQQTKAVERRDDLAARREKREERLAFSLDSHA